MKTFIFSILSVACLSQSVFAKLVPVKFENELCACTGKIEDSKVTAEEFNNTYKMPTPPDQMSWTEFGKHSPASLKSIQEKYQRENADFVKKTKEIKLPKMPEWEKVRTQTLQAADYDSEMYLKSLKYFETQKTDGLLADSTGFKIPVKCQPYAKALASKDETLKMHKSIFDERCKKNGDPAQCAARAEETRKNITEARVEVLSFGWWNCLVEARNLDSRQILGKAQESLEKKIVGKKCECDEP